MGETREVESMSHVMDDQRTRKERRNGMWNIFEGVDNTVLEKLGLSEELVQQLVTEADDTVTEHLSQMANLSVPDADGGCQCQRARILRSFSATVGEDMRAAIQNRHRRNAVGNLFDVLTPSQKLLLVEHLQAQLERLRCFCDDKDHADIILSLKDLSASSSSPSSASPSVSSSCTKGEIECR